MRIGVDATSWHNNRGYGRYTRALISTLARIDTDNRYTLLVDSEPPQAMPSGLEVRQVRASAPTAIAASSSGRRSLPDMWRMSRAMSDPSFDLLLFPTIYSYVPVFSRARKLVVIHDIIAEKYPQFTVPNFSARLFWNAKVALGRRQADAIVTVSDYSRRCLIEHFHLAPDRIFVVGEAGEPVFQVLDRPLPTLPLKSSVIVDGSRIIAYVGGFGPHKNLEMLVSVFARIVGQSEFSDVRLVMVGEYRKEVFHSCYQAIKNRAEDLGISDRVLFTGYLPDQEVTLLLNLATVLVLPSLMEGFGLPAVEAAACGCPVIATRESPLGDLLGAGAICVDPMKPEELESALFRVLTSPDLRRQMRDAGLAAGGRLTWQAAAQQMLSVMQTVMARSSQAGGR